MRCQHCGHEVPEGSVFCNRCGYRMNNEMTCPYCQREIPATSVFCPHCGKAVDDDVDHTPATTTTTTSKTAQQGQTYNEIHQATKQQPQQRPANAWEKPIQEETVEEDDDHGNGKRSHYDRNLIIGIIAAVVLIGLLSLLRHCNNRENDRLEARGDSVAIVADDSQDPLAIFNAELSRANMLDENATTACAVRFPSEDPETPDRIVGVTYNDNSDRPFIKIYKLTREGGAWKPEVGQTKYFDGRSINMDNTSLMADALHVPRAVTIDGKPYLYFAFLNHLKGAGEGDNGRVVQALYDLDSKKITTLTYDGKIKSRTDGRQYVSGMALENANNAERRFLQQEADNIGAIHVKTQEEIDAEKEAQEKEEEEKALEGEENAAAKWDHDNAEKMEDVKNGEEVHMNTHQYEKPIFSLKDIKSKLENDRYLVFLDNKGSVYGFNKSSRKYFTIYSGNNGAASSISMGGNGEVHIKTGHGSISYDLARDRVKKVD